MRVTAAILALVAGVGCDRVFGIDHPQLQSDAASSDSFGELDAAVDTQVDAKPDAEQGTSVISFTQGVGGYTGVIDTNIASGSPNATYASDTLIRYKLDNRWLLIQFDGLFGPGAIPSTATIVDASLTLTFQNPAPGSLDEVAIPWAATVTYNTFGSAAGVDATDVGANVGLVAATMTGALSLDVTASLQRWKTDPSTNNGWIISGTAGNDATVRSSEDATPTARPTLTVTYK